MSHYERNNFLMSLTREQFEELCDAGVDLNPKVEYTPAEEALIERMIRELHGTMPERQMVEEISIALAIHRRQG